MTPEQASAVYFTKEVLEILAKKLYMSPETWEKVIAADPTGWREMFEGKYEE